jgi:hypothetical protein
MKPRQSKTKLSTLIICIVAGTAMVLFLAPAPKPPAPPPSPPFVQPAFLKEKIERLRFEGRNRKINIGTIEIANNKELAIHELLRREQMVAQDLRRRMPKEEELVQRYDLDGDGKLSPAERARAMEDQKTDAGKHIVATPEDE